MKKALKAFVAWLDRKFPDRIEITVVEYTNLTARLTRLEEILSKVSEQRIKEIEAEIRKLNVSLGFGARAGQFAGSPFER